jgi:hypothetical protein
VPPAGPDGDAGRRSIGTSDGSTLADGERPPAHQRLGAGGHVVFGDFRSNHWLSDTAAIPSCAAAWDTLRDVRSVTSRSVAFSISASDAAALFLTHA